jgi:hypothetical protein
MGRVNGRRTPSDGKSSQCLWQGELKMLFLSLKCSDVNDVVSFTYR